MWLNKQDSEYASSPKFAEILNMTKFWIWQAFQDASVTQLTEYARICLDRVLNISWVLNMPGFWIWQGSDCGRITRGCKYATIWLNMSEQDVNMSEFLIIDRVLNMYHTIMHSASSLKKLMSTYSEFTYSELGQRSKMECFGKIIIVFNYFCKKLHLKSLRGFCICVGF